MIVLHILVRKKKSLWCMTALSAGENGDFAKAKNRVSQKIHIIYK